MESMQVLVEPENPDIDIVFVHGLNPGGSEDHARSTWTYTDGNTSVFWPDALLRRTLPSARIMLFSYNSSVWTNASNTPLHSHAQTLLSRLHLRRQKDSEKHRRLIFVAHSLGGLLVKQALVEAGIHSSDYSCIRASTKGLVFFATPHGGGNLAGLAEVAANFTSAVTGSAKNSLLKTLKKNSLLNEVSTDHFRPQSGDYEVLTLIEAKMMDVNFERKLIKFRVVPQITSMYIVNANSAKLGAPRELLLRLNRNHSDICRFSGQEDTDYELVGGNLGLMQGKIQEMAVKCTECNYNSEDPPLQYPPIPYASSIPGAPPSFIGRTGRTIPPINSLPLCKPFVAREELTKEILDTWQKWEGPIPRRISLSGLGGVGKTQLSRSITDQLGQRDATIWLNAGSHSSLQEDLKGAALSLKDELLRAESGPMQANNIHDRGFFYSASARIDYLVELLKVWLSMAQTREANAPKVLAILDDVDGLEPTELFNLSKMVSGNGVDVIFTTRDPTIADRTSYMDAINFDVPPFQKEQARDLLDDLTKADFKQPSGSSVAVTKASNSAETEFLSNVASNLGDLPAALVSGSHYLMDNLASRSPYAVKSYLDKWSSPTDRRQILQYCRFTSRYPYSMQASFEISVRRLRRNTETKDPTLHLCCLNLLRLLSALKVGRFARVELENLSNLLGQFVQAAGLRDITQREKAPNDLLVSLQQLSEDANKAPGCATELIHVSLLTTSNGPGTLVLNQLIRACVMLSAQDGSAANQNLTDPGLNKVETVLLERAARQISEIWAPCLPSPGDIGHMGV